MINHPHDCPVCDEGGECHLQDMTAMTGHVYRRYNGRKRTHLNQDLGPFVNHEMNRCIQCYRCVRFYRDLRGRARLRTSSACHDHVYFGRGFGRCAGIGVLRQPGGGLSHRRVHGQDAEAALHPRVGPPDRALDMHSLRARLQHDSRRSIRRSSDAFMPGTTAM